MKDKIKEARAVISAIQVEAERLNEAAGKLIMRDKHTAEDMEIYHLIREVQSNIKGMT